MPPRGGQSPSALVGMTDIRPTQPTVARSLVMKYAAAMSQGTFVWTAMADNLLIVRAPNGKFLVDGHHRFIAARMAKVIIPPDVISYVDRVSDWPVVFEWSNVQWIP